MFMNLMGGRQSTAAVCQGFAVRVQPATLMASLQRALLGNNCVRCGCSMTGGRNVGMATHQWTSAQQCFSTPDCSPSLSTHAAADDAMHSTRGGAHMQGA